MAARNVVRFLKKAKISFSSFDTEAAGACEFYRQMVARKTLNVNPKAVVEYETTLYGTKPTINLEFIDGTKQKMEVPNRNVRDIFEDIDFHCSRIEAEYELQGKEIE